MDLTSFAKNIPVIIQRLSSALRTDCNVSASWWWYEYWRSCDSWSCLFIFSRLSESYGIYGMLKANMKGQLRPFWVTTQFFYIFNLYCIHLPLCVYVTCQNNKHIILTLFRSCLCCGWSLTHVAASHSGWQVLDSGQCTESWAGAR